ncbi:MAG: hypothetical protein A2X41_04290 [Candidatus Margulisbacteria bacterium GWE2_39_32]|nr:MAG: hypothetical protein A2X41_04290 [Candidatus Margulisbacteria bacterium GWE2_39_32]
MKITDSMKERRKQNIDHLAKIQGQMATLSAYMDSDKCCMDIAMLTTSIAKSFDSLRTKTLEGFILNELFDSEKITPAKQEKLSRILDLYKK